MMPSLCNTHYYAFFHPEPTIGQVLHYSVKSRKK